MNPALIVAALFAVAGPQIEIFLRLDKEQFEVGEAIPATLEIFNRGAEEYPALSSTEPTGVMDGITFAVTDAASNAVPIPVRLTKPDTWIGSWLVLRRHEKCERKLFLNHGFMPLSPGRFAVQATYVPRGTNDWPGIQSQRVEFEIVPTTSMKLDVRITRLTEQSEKGDEIAVDFLGFTGENAAIAPLTEALYSDDFHIQRRAAVALSLINDQGMALKLVLKKADELGPTAMIAEWLAVAKAPPQLILPIYLRAMNAHEPMTRLGGMTGLRLGLNAALADKRFATPTRWAIRHALADRDSRVRYEAVLTTQLHPEPQTIDILKNLAKADPVARVRNAAAAVLREIPPGTN